jgi:hypothetical protein
VGRGRKKWSERLTTEDCFSINIVDLNRAGVFEGGSVKSCTCRAFCSTVGISLVVEIGNHGEGQSAIELRYVNRFVGDQRRLITLSVCLTHTSCRLGGVRRWFLCPSFRSGSPCGRRVGKLYLPPGGWNFACRDCWNLTYVSAQTHDKRVNWLAKMPLEYLVSALSSQNASHRLMGIRTINKLITRLRKRARINGSVLESVL